MAESNLVQLNIENSNYNVSSIVFMYIFSMLNLGHILISDLFIADLFTHLLPGMILLYFVTLLLEVFLHET